MKGFIEKYSWELAGLVIGAVAGFCYWYFVGCASGNCMITSRPANSSVYGAIMGALSFSLLKGSNTSKNNSNKSYE